MASAEMIQWGRERVRAGPWRGDRRVAFLNPVPGAPLPSPDFLRRCLGTLAGRGFGRVVTGALAPSEQAGFRAVGFSVAEDLHLLSHDLQELVAVDVPGVALRRARTADRPAVLEVDQVAFQPFWRLDDSGLDDAINATPHARFRIARDAERGAVVGYAITGRAGRRGYVQRIAVDPARHGSGVGRLLLLDGLRWLRRWRVERAMVNTQLDNSRALGLYEATGFRRERTRLSVLGIELGDA